MSDHWRACLASWAIPDEIRAQAPATPYRMDPALFRPRPAAEASPEGAPSLATERAVEALPAGGSVLDVGCGGGAAAFAIGDRVGSVVGVDESSEMLDLFAAEAERRAIPHRQVLGRWPDVANTAGRADVVVCHHVAYNVADLADFALALGAAARHRVVMELTLEHPQTINNPLWKHFWDLDRPDCPTAEDALAVLVDAGIAATLEIGATTRLRAEVPWEARVASSARSLCLGEDRLDEVAREVAKLPARTEDRAVLWWDVPSGR